jgi:hypothetical protein
MRLALLHLRRSPSRAIAAAASFARPCTAPLCTFRRPVPQRPSQPSAQTTAAPLLLQAVREFLPDAAIESALGDAMASDTGGDGGPVIIDGKATADTIRDELRVRVQALTKEFGRVSGLTKEFGRGRGAGAGSR